MEITVKRVKGIEHNDPEAAGFTDGYRWSFTDSLGMVESYAATRDEAIDCATAAAVARGADPETITV